MFAFVASFVILLTIAVVALSIFAVVTRWLGNVREARIGAQRRVLLRAIRRFLADEVPLEDVVAVVPPDRTVALGAMVSAASQAPPEQFPRLRVLIQHLHLHDQDLISLRHRDWTRRAHAATRLGILRIHAAETPLIHLLDDAMLDVRLAAANSLAQLGATSAIEPILRSLALPVAWPLQRCAEILHEMGPSAIEPLLAAQKGGRLPASGTAVVARVLGMLRAGAAVPTLVTLLSHGDTEIRVSSAKALGQIGSADATPALRQALSDKVWPVRSAAAKALGEIEDRHALPELELALADEAWWVRFNAAEALHRLGGLAQLTRAATHHADRFARDISRQVLEQYGIPVTATVPA